jgi:hypothetical protein
MRKEKTYARAIFDANVIQEARDLIGTLFEGGKMYSGGGEISRGVERWSFNSAGEFFAEYRAGFISADYSVAYMMPNADAATLNFHLRAYNRPESDNPSTEIWVQTDERRHIERIFDVFERHYREAVIPAPPAPEAPPPPPPTVFIGHGRSQQWQDLKDHLHEQHGYAVEAYEIGARAGHAIRDILVDMLVRSSFAILLMTGEDETTEGQLRARQNVVHEIGLFQGRLGFNRAIVLVEEGVELFSNLQGIQQVRYSRGNIRETYGDILATLRREFGQR